MTKQRSLSLASWVMVVIVVSIIGYGAVLFGTALTYPSDRASVHVTRVGFAVDVAPEGSPLQKGDVIVGINGREADVGIGTPGSWRDFLFAERLSETTYTVLRDDQRLDVLVSWQLWHPLALLLRIAPFLIVALSFVATLLLIMTSRAYDSVAVLGALNFCVQALNLVNNTITSTGANLTARLAWFHAPLDLLTFSLGLSLFLHVLLVFPEKKWVLRRFPASIYLIHVLNVGIAVLAIVGVGSGSVLKNRAMIFGRMLFPLAAVEMLVAMGHLIHTYLTSRQPGVRNQIRWMMWGVVGGPLPWLLLFNIPVVLFGRPLVPLAIASLPLILISIAAFFSMTRQGLLVVDTLINRSVVFVGLMMLLWGGYLILVRALEPALRALIGAHDVRLAAFIAACVIAAVATPLRTWLQALVNRALLRQQSDLQRLLPEVGQRLSTTLRRDTLVALLEEEIPQRLHIARAVLLLRGDESVLQAVSTRLQFPADHPLLGQLAESDTPAVFSQLRDRGVRWANFDAGRWELAVPLRSGERLLGLYLLSPRLTGDLYGQDEIEMLARLGQQIAGALENAQLYQQVEAYSQGLEDVVAERTRELEITNQVLSKERDRLNVIIQNMADGLLVVNPAGQIVLVNPAFEAIVGLTRADILAHPVHEALRCAQLVALIEHVAAEPGPALQADCTLEGRILRASSVALPDGSGTITVVRDVTHEVEVDRMKTEFISSISHELRTPLTSVVGFAKLVQKSLGRDIAPVLPEDRRAQRALRRTLANLDIINVEADRLAQLVNDVLDIAKMESGKVEWNDERFALASAVEQAVAAVTPQSEQKGLALVVDLDEAVPPLVADPARIYQVLFNLLSNAVKFTEAGTVTVMTRFVAADEMVARWAYPAWNRSGVLISVRDTGLGIPTDEIPQLFQRFKQVWEDALISKPQGTGLGLAICREIVTHYGGYIWVESEVGKGSDFQFVLPLAPAPTALAGAVDFPRVVDMLPRPRVDVSAVEPHEVTVLVVDDDANVRSLLTQELEDVGYNVLQAANGIDALVMARRYRPSAVVLDVMMPGLSGFDVVQLLKSDLTTAMIPVVMLSIIEDKEKGLVLGADAYLTKPVEVEVLLDTLVGVLSPMVRRPPSAVVAEMDQSALEQISRILREQGFQVASAYDSRGAILAAQQVPPDAAAFDEMLSGVEAARVVKALRFQQKVQGTTIVVVAGLGMPEVPR